MNVVETYKLDIFSVVVLIVVIVLIVFLVVAAIYFYNNWSNSRISTGESSGLFWTSIVVLVLLVGLAVYALIKIFTHKVLVVKEEDPKILAVPQTTVVRPVPVMMNHNQTQPQMMMNHNQTQPQMMMNHNQTQPQMMMNNGKVYQPSYVQRTSDLPLTTDQRNRLTAQIDAYSNSLGA